MHFVSGVLKARVRRRLRASVWPRFDNDRAASYPARKKVE
jgi:hypothetical protein